MRTLLTHGAWPASLAALPPVPTDVIGGGPLHYRPEANGAFTLYSIGWNGRDDGGVTAWKGAGSQGVDWKNGDWVGPCIRRDPPRSAVQIRSHADLPRGFVECVEAALFSL